MSDKCILCGKDSGYDIDTPVESRQFYMAGAGQLCPDCWHELFPPSSESEQLREMQAKLRAMHAK